MYNLHSQDSDSDTSSIQSRALWILSNSFNDDVLLKHVHTSLLFFAGWVLGSVHSLVFFSIAFDSQDKKT